VMPSVAGTGKGRGVLELIDCGRTEPVHFGIVDRYIHSVATAEPRITRNSIDNVGLPAYLPGGLGGIGINGGQNIGVLLGNSRQIVEIKITTGSRAIRAKIHIVYSLPAPRHPKPSYSVGGGKVHRITGIIGIA